MIIMDSFKGEVPPFFFLETFDFAAHRQAESQFPCVRTSTSTEVSTTRTTHTSSKDNATAFTTYTSADVSLHNVKCQRVKRVLQTEIWKGSNPSCLRSSPSNNRKNF